MRLPQRLAETKGKYQVVLETGELQAGECSDEPGGPSVPARSKEWATWFEALLFKRKFPSVITG